MIEVLDIQKNFIDGTETIKRKLKDQTLTRGKATIQLFDKNNKCIQETVSNNFITNPISNASLYGRLAIDLGILNAYRYNFNDYRFKQLQLRNGDFEENPNEVFMKGSVVGYCNRTDTNAGSDVLKGTYNTTESFEEYTKDGYYHAHLVYDFSTSQGNGEFNHVYWTTTPINAASTTPTAINYASIAEQGHYGKRLSIGNSLFIDAFGNLLRKSSDSYYIVKNKHAVVNRIADDAEIDLSEPVEYIPSYSRVEGGKAITIEGSYKGASSPSDRACNITINLINSNYEIEKKKEINLFDLDGFARLNNKIGNYSAYFCFDKLKTISCKGIVYFTVKCYSNSNKVIPYVNEDGTYTEDRNTINVLLAYDIINDTWVIEPNPYSYICNRKGSDTFYLADNYYIGNDTYLWFIGTSIYMFNAKDLTYKTIYISGSTSYFNNGIDFENNIGLYYFSSYFDFYKFLPYSSHTKLPNPVVKTNTTTMKITYDYYIQVPNFFSETGNEFNWG